MSPERRPPDVDDEFLTVAEVAAILKLNQQTIRNWISQASLPALRASAVACGSCAAIWTNCSPTPRRRQGVEERTVTDEPGTHQGWRDAERFWGGA